MTDFNDEVDVDEAMALADDFRPGREDVEPGVMPPVRIEISDAAVAAAYRIYWGGPSPQSADMEEALRAAFPIMLRDFLWSDEMVERAARVMWEDDQSLHDMSWEPNTDYYLGVARRMLAAALGQEGTR